MPEQLPVAMVLETAVLSFPLHFKYVLDFEGVHCMGGSVGLRDVPGRGRGRGEGGRERRECEWGEQN